MRAFAIIPARGGSKGVPGKNLRKVGGKSLVARAVDTCLAAGLPTWVSTDSPDIAAEALAHGAKVIDRPTELATDTATTDEVLVHAAWTLWARTEDDVIVCVQATCPFLEASDLTRALDAWTRRRGSVVAMREFTGFLWGPAPDRPWCCASINMADGSRPMRQKWPEQWLESGHFYIVGAKDLLQEKTRIVNPVHAFAMPVSRCLDIDEERDLKLARRLAGQGEDDE